MPRHSSLVENVRSIPNGENGELPGWVKIDIAAILTITDGKTATEERRRDALEALFKSLLHHLMTGKLRLPEFSGQT